LTHWVTALFCADEPWPISVPEPQEIAGAAEDVAPPAGLLAEVVLPPEVELDEVLLSEPQAARVAMASTPAPTAA